MKTYITTDKHPTLKAGAEFIQVDFGWSCNINYGNPESNPDWFEEKRWRPEEGEKYLYLVDDGEWLINTYDKSICDEQRISIGNCFPLDTPQSELDAIRERVIRAYNGE